MEWNGIDYYGMDSGRCKKMHGGKRFKEKNELGDTILEFALAFNLVISNTKHLLKREVDLITHKSGIGAG